MFTRITSILLISLFILTQYGRQASYLQCKIENFTSKSKAPVCDCEKSNAVDPGATDKLPAQKTHFHSLLDEYYVLNENDYSKTARAISLKHLYSPVSFASSFNGNIFHPPQL